MAATDKRGPIAPPRPVEATPPKRVVVPPLPSSKPATAPASTAAARAAVAGRSTEAITTALREAAADKAPYFKFAFANPYNLSLFLGGLAASLLTLNPVLALVAIGGEALWLLHAPENPVLRRLFWDPKFEKLRTALEAQEREARVRGLGDAERERVNDLVLQQQEIRRLAAGNPSFTGELLRTELQKTDRLVDAFIDMAVTCARYEGYLESVNLQALEGDRLRWERAVQSAAANDPQVDIAKKNLAIIMRRQDKMKEIRRYLSDAKGQLDLIDNSFRLIADQIVTMQSPQQMSSQLDELLDGVEAIRQTAVDTEQMLNGN